MKVLLGCTGSVASIKVPKLVDNITGINDEVEVKVITTERATHFYDCESLQVPVLRDSDEWEQWKQRGDPVLHIELRRWADVFLIAPLDANTLAKLACGLCDNLLTCVVRAWDFKKPVLFAPAMNSVMWEHPLTAQHISKLRELGFKEIPCVEKLLMCNEIAMGAMAEVESIVKVLKQTTADLKPIGERDLDKTSN